MADRAAFAGLFALIAAATSDTELEALIDDITAVEDTACAHDLAQLWQRRWVAVTDRPLTDVVEPWTRPRG